MDDNMDVGTAVGKNDGAITGDKVTFIVLVVVTFTVGAAEGERVGTFDDCVGNIEAADTAAVGLLEGLLVVDGALDGLIVELNDHDSVKHEELLLALDTPHTDTPLA
jgi:hypothetical protein